MTAHIFQTLCHRVETAQDQLNAAKKNKQDYLRKELARLGRTFPVYARVDACMQGKDTVFVLVDYSLSEVESFTIKLEDLTPQA